jgi:hypothetical protein
MPNTSPDSMTLDQINRCAIIGKVMSFLENNPDAVEKLNLLIQEDKLLWSTDDVMTLTGWSNGHIIRLCSQGILPYVPGNPHKFVPRALVAALEQMQVGGIYGRKSRAKKRKTA